MSWRSSWLTAATLWILFCGYLAKKGQHVCFQTVHAAMQRSIAKGLLLWDWACCCAQSYSQRLAASCNVTHWHTYVVCTSAAICVLAVAKLAMLLLLWAVQLDAHWGLTRLQLVSTATIVRSLATAAAVLSSPMCCTLVFDQIASCQHSNSNLFAACYCCCFELSSCTCVLDQI